MKGEYGTSESKNDTNNTMFGAKLHHHHFQTFTTPHHHHHFQQTSEEDNTSRSSGGGAGTAPSTALTAYTTPKTLQQQHGDGATIEALRRPRGRPPGSKNKPKPPIIITREPEPAMSPYILEIPVGADVIDTITRFSRRRNIGLCILSGSGTVANVTLRQPTNNTPPVTFHGRYDILSLAATFQVQSSSSSTLAAANHIAISLAGPQGQIFGGAVAGPLIVAGTVFIIAASFNHPTYHRLPIDEEEVVHNSVSGSGNDNNNSSPPPPSSGGGGGQVDSLFSCHLPSDVIWAPTATRQSQPPPSY